MHRPPIRLVASTLVGAALLGACASSSTGAETTLSPSATAWRTVPPVEATALPTMAPVATIKYTVQQGDYANSIAGDAGGGCSGAEIMAANPTVVNLDPGTVIDIPSNCLGPGITEDILNNKVVTSITDAPKKTTTTVVKYNTYTVKSGDFWVRIARKVGCTYRQLKAANPDRKKLFAGDVLKVPKSCDTRKK